MQAIEPGKTDWLLMLLEYLNGLPDGGAVLVRFSESFRVAKQIRAVCSDENNGMGDAVKAIEEMLPLDPLVIMHLALTEAQMKARLKAMQRESGRKGGAQAHRRSYEDRHFRSGEEMRAKAVETYKSLRDTYPDKKAKAIYADVATAFDVNARTIANWVSAARKSKKHHATG